MDADKSVLEAKCVIAMPPDQRSGGKLHQADGLEVAFESGQYFGNVSAAFHLFGLHISRSGLRVGIYRQMAVLDGAERDDAPLALIIMDVKMRLPLADAK